MTQIRQVHSAGGFVNNRSPSRRESPSSTNNESDSSDNTDSLPSGLRRNRQWSFHQALKDKQSRKISLPTKKSHGIQRTRGMSMGTRPSPLIYDAIAACDSSGESSVPSSPLEAVSINPKLRVRLEKIRQESIEKERRASVSRRHSRPPIILHKLGLERKRSASMGDYVGSNRGRVADQDSGSDHPIIATCRERTVSDTTRTAKHNWKRLPRLLHAIRMQSISEKNLSECSEEEDEDIDAQFLRKNSVLSRKSNKNVLVIGRRQSGKSTLISLLKQRNHSECFLPNDLSDFKFIDVNVGEHEGDLWQSLMVDGVIVVFNWWDIKSLETALSCLALLQSRRNSSNQLNILAGTQFSPAPHYIIQPESTLLAAESAAKRSGVPYFVIQAAQFEDPENSAAALDDSLEEEYSKLEDLRFLIMQGMGAGDKGVKALKARRKLTRSKHRHPSVSCEDIFMFIMKK